MYNQVKGAGLPENHASLGQDPLLAVAVRLRPGAVLVPGARPLVGFLVPGPLETGEECRQLFQPAIVQALVLAAGVQYPGQFMTGLLQTL